MKRKPIATIPPLTREELNRNGVDVPDFVLISGDAYVDHPSFGAAIIARLLQQNGYSIGVIAQPDWHSAHDFQRFGKPRLGFLVTSGNIDSMVNHYSVAGHKRKEDSYSPGGRAGLRPDRAVIVYANRCREAYAHVPVILGGIEASLRRFAHYDYWDKRVRHSILYDACADLLVYGMGEKAMRTIADLLDAGTPVDAIRSVPGTCCRVAALNEIENYQLLPSYQEVSSDKRRYAEAFMAESDAQDAITGKTLVQAHEKGFLVANPPAMPLSTVEMDAVYAMPFTRKQHPFYREKIPALDEVSFSITSARGCFGGCSFCALTFHQGRTISPRSHESILQEATLLTKDKSFAGYIHDIGGPTANFRRPSCQKQLKSGVCRGRQCIGFEKCERLEVSHSDYVALLQKLRQLPRVKKVFIRSGIRYDYLMYDRNREFLEELVAHHISGQLKVAPEHVSDRVLYYMNKPAHALYERFVQAYTQMNKKLGKDQYLVPYLISSHPGAELSDAIELAQYLKKNNIHPEQVQDFYPTPGTLSTCMFYTGLDPRTMQPVYSERTPEEKAMQRALMQCFLPANYALVRKALRKADRDDLIGSSRDCLVPAEPNRTFSAKTKGREGKNAVDKRRRSR